MRTHFTRFATRASEVMGSIWALLLALLVVFVWAASGPVFGFSDTWQLVINTGTTIITFLMVFLIQNTQNRDTKAIQLKLDELLRAVEGARQERFVDLELKDEQEQEEVRELLFEECGICSSPEEHVRHGSHAPEQTAGRAVAQDATS